MEGGRGEREKEREKKKRAREEKRRERREKRGERRGRRGKREREGVEDEGRRGAGYLISIGRGGRLENETSQIKAKPSVDVLRVLCYESERNQKIITRPNNNRKQ